MKKLILINCLLVLSFTSFCHAHEARPLYIELTEQAKNVFHLRWKMPAVAEAASAPIIVLSQACQNLDETALVQEQTPQFYGSRLYRCEKGLSDQTLSLIYPKYNPAVSTLLKLKWLSGETRTILKGPEQTVIDIPTSESASGVTLSYFVQGIKHLLFGYDHLLFVLCLLFIARTLKRILLAVTGFTVAHSLTLALSSLGFINVAVAPTEVVIALSITFLAYEALKGHQGITERYPIVVCMAFGLLHGLGFASVLGELGLPQTQKLLALLSFNVGIEVAQVLFILVLCLVFFVIDWLIQKERTQQLDLLFTQNSLRIPMLYLAGGVSLYWACERFIGFFV